MLYSQKTQCIKLELSRGGTEINKQKFSFQTAYFPDNFHGLSFVVNF